MKSIVTLLTIGIATLLLSGMPALAASGHGGAGHASASADTGKEAMGFKHHDVADGVRSEFQIMSLTSMKMKDEQGATHHVMVKLFDEKSRSEIKEAVGKIKIISPNGSEQENTLQNYSGILAANFNFDAAGKYGVICLIKMTDGQKRVVKFWYNHKG